MTDSKNLVLLPTTFDIEGEEQDALFASDIIELPWYLITDKDGNSCLCGDEKMHLHSEDDPIDAGIDMESITIETIDDIYKRWNKIDGFYTA